MRVAFLDRDGVINVDHGYVYRIDAFEFLPDVIDALRRLVDNGFALIIVTNQSGIGRGYYSEVDYQTLTDWYVSELAKQDVNILDVFHCPHTPQDNCQCRKPKIGLFEQACKKYCIDMNESLMVGDKQSDVEAARAAGVNYRYLIGGSKQAPPFYSSLMHSVESHLRLQAADK